MNLLIAALLSGLAVVHASDETAQPPAEDDSAEQAAPISMDWEELPATDVPTAWLGLGTSIASDALVNGSGPMAVGLDLRWVPDAQMEFRFTHRTWRSPSANFESELAGQGVTEGVQNFWAGRMRATVHYRFVVPGSSKIRGGFQMGPSVLRTRHVSRKTQQYLKRRHGIHWGPRWTLAAGPEAHMGIYGEDESLQLTTFGRYHAPFATRHNQRGSGVLLNGRMYDPVEVIQPEADIGGLFGIRTDPFYLQLEIASRVFGPSKYDRVSERRWWRGMLVSDLTVGVAL